MVFPPHRRKVFPDTLHLRTAKTPGVAMPAFRLTEFPAVLPLGPTLLSMKVEHFGHGQQSETVIVRNFDRPERCKLCPRSKCNADGGFCLVRAKGNIPDALCASYVLPTLAVVLP